MARNTGQVTFDIEFISKGLKNIEGSVVGLTKNIQATKKTAESIFGGTSTSFAAYEKQLDGLLKKANTTFSSIRKLKEDAFQEDLDASDIEYLSSSLKRVAGELGGLTNNLSGTRQAINGSVQGVVQNVKNLLSNLKQMGTSSETMTELSQKFKKVQNTLKETGDSKYLFQFNKDLEKSTQNAARLDSAMVKLSKLQIDSPKIATTTTKLGDTKGQAISGEASPQQVSGALRQANTLTAELLTKQRELLKIQKDSKATLESSLKGLAIQKDYLEKTRASQVGIASSGDIAKADSQLAAINKKIKRLKVLESVTLKALNPRSVDAYANKIKVATVDIEGMAKATTSIGNEVKLSKNFENAKIAATSLNKEISQLKKILTGTSSGALQQLESQIVAIQGKLSTKGQIQPKVAKDELNAINKKLGLLKQISNYETQIATAQASNSINSAETTKLLAGVKSFREEVVKSSGSIGILSDKMKSLYAQLGNKVASDKGFDKIIVSYNEQIKALERLINAKTKWASTEDIKKAQVEVTNLKTKVSQAVKEKEKFNILFQTDSAKAIRHATASVQVLNNTLRVSKDRARDAGAELTKISTIKWFQNIAARAAAYMGLYQGMTGVTRLISSGTQYLLEFDQASHTLSAVLDMSAASAGRLETRLAGLSVQFGGSLKDINEAALALGRAGFDKAEVASGTENIIKMARLTGDSFAVSANALITYREVFGTVKDEVTGLTPSVEDLADKLAYVANQSRLSTQDIGTFSNYALAAAKSSGMTANTVSSMAIAFSNAGVNASTIGTQIRRFSNVISETSAEVTNFFLQMGMDQEMMMGRMRMGTQESNKVMVEFVSKLKNMSASEFSRITRGMDILALQSVTLLRNNADMFFTHLKKLNAGVEGEVNKANYVTDSYRISWEKLGNSLGLAFSKSVGNLLPTVKRAVDGSVVSLDGLGRKFMAISQNWDDFKSKFQSAMALLSSVVAAFTISTLSGMVGGFVALASRVGLVTAAIQQLGMAVGVVGRHPLILLLTLIGGAAYYAMSGLNAAVKASSNLSQAAALSSANNRVRELQNTYNESGKAADYEKLLLAQKLVGKLTNDLNLAATVLDAKSAITQAQAKAGAYSSIASRADNPALDELTKVAGSQTKVAVTQAIQGVKSVAETALKSLPASEKERSQQLSEFLATLELDLKKVAQSNFEDGSNLSQIGEWNKYLGDLGAQAEKVGVAFGDTAKVIQNSKVVIEQSNKQAPFNLAEALKNKSELEKLEPSATAKELPKMASLLAKIEGLLGGQLTVFSVNKTDSEKTANTPTSGSSVSVLMNSEEEALKVINTMEKYQNSLQNLGKVMLETKKNTDGTLEYFVKIQQGSKAQFPGKVNQAGYGNFSVKSPRSPSISQNTPTNYNTDTPTRTIKIVSNEEINNLKRLAQNIQTQYSSFKDVSALTDSTVIRLSGTIDKIKQQQEAMINSAIESAPEMGKELLKQFAIDFSKSIDPETAIADFSTKVNIKRDNDMQGVTDPAKLEAIQSAYGAINESVKKFADSSRLVLELETQQAKLLELGKVKVAEQTDLHKETEDRMRGLAVLRAQATEAEQKFSAISENRVRVVTQSSLLEKQLQDLKAKSIKDEIYYEELLNKRDVITDKINKYNASGIKDKKIQVDLEKQSKDINIKIAEQYKLNTKALSDELVVETKLVDEKGKELEAVRSIRAEYANAINKTSKYGKDLDVVKEIQRIVQSTGGAIDVAEAAGLVSKKYGAQNAGAAGSKTYSDYLTMGENNFSARGMKDNEAAINQEFDTTDSNIKAQQLADQMQQDEYKRQLTNENSTLELEERAFMNTRVAELDNANAQRELDLAQSVADRKASIRAAENGARISQAKSAFNALGNIANAYYILSGKKSKTAFKVMQAMQVASAIANTYSAAIKAYDSMASIPYVGPALGVVAASGAIAMGMANVAQIKAQTFHTGGYVSDDNKTRLKSDEIPAILQTGEYVLSRSDLKAIKDTSGNTVAPVLETKNSEVVIVNSLDPAIIEQYLTSRAGRQIINNAIK